jgi:hypothetical protein
MLRSFTGPPAFYGEHHPCTAAGAPGAWRQADGVHDPLRPLDLHGYEVTARHRTDAAQQQRVDRAVTHLADDDA